MANDTETLADISAELRDKCATHYCCEEARRKDGEYPEGFDVIDTSELANRIDAAAKRAEAKWEGAACACVSDAVMSGNESEAYAATMAHIGSLKEIVLEEGLGNNR